MLIRGPSVRTARRRTRRRRSWRDRPCDVHSLTDVGQVGVAFLIGPVSCSDVEKKNPEGTVTVWDLAIFIFFPTFVWNSFTFNGRHVDTFTIPAQWMRSAESPGDVVEHRMVRPAETTVVFVAVEAHPPFGALHFYHLNVKKKKIPNFCQGYGDLED